MIAEPTPPLTTHVLKDTRPRAPGGPTKSQLLASAAAEALGTDGAEGGEAPKPALHVRAFCAVIGGLVGALIFALGYGLIWLILHGFALALIFCALVFICAFIGASSAAERHVKQWGSRGFKK